MSIIESIRDISGIILTGIIDYVNNKCIPIDKMDKGEVNG
jgi:hypothetical protein